MQAFRKILISQGKQCGSWFRSKRHCSNSIAPLSEFVEKSNYLFSQEQKRQLEAVGRVEKITVEVSGPPEDAVLVMNQNISTPYDCCRHISLPFSQRTPLALVNGELWDMHRPLPGDCRIKFLSFRDDDPFYLNQAFWRTGSFVLGAVITKVFKDDVKVLLHSFPHPFVKSGSFVYDVKLNVEGWVPTDDELKIMSAEFLKFTYENHKIERLQVNKSVAMEIFEGNPFKLHQIPQIAAKAEDKLVTLYRAGDHIDISRGPMIADTSFFGRCTVAAVFYISQVELYRFQGVALPKGIMLNSHAFDVLIRRASFVNEAPVPGLLGENVGITGAVKLSDVDVDPTPTNLDPYRS